MTPKAKPVRTCDECKWDGGQHYTMPDGPDGPVVAVRCPNYLSADAQIQAQTLTADAHTKAFQAAKAIIRDAAETLPEFSGNQTRAAFEDAQIPTPVIGAAFSACRRDGLIAETGRFVQSTEASTRHRIAVWTSLAYRKSVAS